MKVVVEEQVALSPRASDMSDVPEVFGPAALNDIPPRGAPHMFAPVDRQELALDHYLYVEHTGVQ